MKSQGQILAPVGVGKYTIVLSWSVICCFIQMLINKKKISKLWVYYKCFWKDVLQTRMNLLKRVLNSYVLVNYERLSASIKKSEQNAGFLSDSDCRIHNCQNFRFLISFETFVYYNRHILLI